MVLSDESTETETAPLVITNTTTVERIDVNGRVLGGPWTLPAGEVLTGPPRAVAGGILTETNNPRGDQTLSVWDPDTGHVERIGPFRDLIDAYTARGATSSIVAYTAAGCRTVGCSLVIARVPGGAPRRVATPDRAPGFIGGGAFSPDGRQLAAFIDRVPESENPGGELVIIDVATATAKTVAGSAVSFGEPFGFATWSPDGRWVYFGGLSPRIKAHYRDTPDAVSLALPPNYSVVAGSPDSVFKSLR